MNPIPDTNIPIKHKDASNDREREALCFLQTIGIQSRKQLLSIKEYFSSYQEAVLAPEIEYKDLIPDVKSKAIIKAKTEMNLKTPYENTKKSGARLFLYEDDEFPAKLRDIPDPPLALYVLGSLPAPNYPSVAIVGSRNSTAYGREMAAAFATHLAKYGIQIISGMARGIDGIAENAALENGGYSCGVLGCGVDICYPSDNRMLYELSIKRGGIISEYPIGSKPMTHYFPQRNRIISGLSDALLVIEARKKSGTLITVNMALEQGRDIYALPGRITDSLSQGCNLLIRDGATPLLSPEDFVEEFLENTGFEYLANSDASVKNSISSIPLERLTEDERLIISVLDYIPKSVSEIYGQLCNRSHITIPVLMQLLTGLVLSGYIHCVDGSNYHI